ncbi:MAG: YggS family pyridoxal phosphate-dependent enzyme [Finegoldia sp.]|nr:YggS family pyridoxal phosphate-dependent enzyme [Finegoldia sp.]
MSIKDNLEEVLLDMEKYANKDENPILIAVTKTVDTDRIREALDFGIKNIGENKPQELKRKYEELGPDINYHMIGHLQTNKVKDLIGKTTLIHSLDRINLLEEIEKRAEKENTVMDCLIQINIAKEEQKSGLYLEDLDSFIQEVEKCKFVKVKGLMNIATNYDDPEKVRPEFKKMREIFDKLAKENYNNIEMKFLSMGMSHDYKIALEEGSNMIRVGSKIFGKRNYN